MPRVGEDSFGCTWIYTGAFPPNPRSLRLKIRFRDGLRAQCVDTGHMSSFPCSSESCTKTSMLYHEVTALDCTRIGPTAPGYIYSITNQEILFSYVTTAIPHSTILEAPHILRGKTRCRRYQACESCRTLSLSLSLQLYALTTVSKLSPESFPIRSCHASFNDPRHHTSRRCS